MNLIHIVCLKLLFLLISWSLAWTTFFTLRLSRLALFFSVWNILGLVQIRFRRRSLISMVMIMFRACNLSRRCIKSSSCDYSIVFVPQVVARAMASRLMFVGSRTTFPWLVVFFWCWNAGYRRASAIWWCELDWCCRVKLSICILLMIRVASWSFIFWMRIIFGGIFLTSGISLWSSSCHVWDTC